MVELCVDGLSVIPSVPLPMEHAMKPSLMDVIREQVLPIIITLLQVLTHGHVTVHVGVSIRGHAP